MLAKPYTGFTDGSTSNPNGQLITIVTNRLNGGTIPIEQSRKRGTIHQRIRVGDGGSQRHGLEVSPLSFAPIQRALLPYVKETDQHDADINHHLPEAKHLQFTQ